MKERVKAFEQTGLIEIAPFYILKEEDGYCINMQVKHITDGGPIVSLNDIEVIAKQLLEFADEVRNKDKFSVGESYFFVHPTGDIRRVTRETTFTGFFQDNLLMTMDNIFKTEKEAEEHKEEILAKFEEARKKYVRD